MGGESVYCTYKSRGLGGMGTRYNIYFAGEITKGQDVAVVRENLAKLFKADAATLEQLFSGKANLIKRNCDADTAHKYEQAMERAGAIALIKPAEATAGENSQASQQEAQQSAAPAAADPISKAAKIAALAAAADQSPFAPSAAPSAERQGATADAADSAPSPSPSSAESAAQSDGGIHLLPEGTAVLEESERAVPEELEIDTGDLAVDESTQRLSEEAPPPPPAPDTSHLDVAAVGETIPNLPSREPELTPNAAGISIVPGELDLSDCAPPPPPPPALDLSSIELAPEGTDMLEEEYRASADAPPPATDHLSLEK